MHDARRSLRIADKAFEVFGDEGYLKNFSDQFEPSTVAMLRALCKDGAQAIDVGANIGLTSLALSQFCSRVVGFEPVGRTFSYLERNIQGASNVIALHSAIGSAPGELRMQVVQDFLAGSFVADTYESHDDRQTVEVVPVKTLDGVFSELGLSRLDFVKVDVEGFELEVLEGGRQIISDLKPLTYLEMNHWCLNVFRRVSIPEFRERLLSIFPYVYAINPDSWLDYGDEKNVHEINYRHVVRNEFSNLVAGFDKDEIVGRLHAWKASLPKIESTTVDGASHASSEKTTDDARYEREIRELTVAIESAKKDNEATISKLAELSQENKALLSSTSWRVTAPLRVVANALRKTTLR